MKKSTEVPPYSLLAENYDELMDHVDYDHWVELILSVLQSAGLRFPRNNDTPSILDCACGTGSISLRLARSGYRIDAFDQSKEMVSIAIEKAKSLNINANFYTGSFKEIEDNDQYDAVICIYDSINYILSKNSLLDFFSHVKRTLKPGGIFFFDICTAYNSCKYFSKHVQKLDTENVCIRREMRYRRFSRIQENIFRFKSAHTASVEIHKQKIYTEREISRYLSQTGWDIRERVYNFDRNRKSMRPLRIHFCCKLL